MCAPCLFVAPAVVLNTNDPLEKLLQDWNRGVISVGFSATQSRLCFELLPLLSSFLSLHLDACQLVVGSGGALWQTVAPTAWELGCAANRLWPSLLLGLTARCPGGSGRLDASAPEEWPSLLVSHSSGLDAEIRRSL